MERNEIIQRLWEIHSALDEHLGDSDIDWRETAEELRDEDPVQWAALHLMGVIRHLEGQ